MFFVRSMNYSCLLTLFRGSYLIWAFRNFSSNSQVPVSCKDSLWKMTLTQEVSSPSLWPSIRSDGTSKQCAFVFNFRTRSYKWKTPSISFKNSRGGFYVMYYTYEHKVLPSHKAVYDLKPNILSKQIIL